jgi:hypothetical protein
MVRRKTCNLKGTRIAEFDGASTFRPWEGPMKTIDRIVAATALSAILILVPAAARAQDAPKQQVSASPFLIMYKYFNVEFERRATDATTWGVSTSFVPSGSADYRNVGAFWHFYPAGHALRGFYIGGRVQVHHGVAGTESATFGGVGFELGKNWIIGRRTLVGLGVGATRLFGGALAGDSLTLPTFRIANVGVTF